MTTLLLSFLVLFNLACNNQEVSDIEDENNEGFAVVENVTVSGEEGNYTFSVALKSPDKGCGQYANWWEVISDDGKTLIYRRILGHSHVGEQPFTRSGGAVSIDATQEVIIRGHMYPTGYGDGKIAMKGSVTNGFQLFEIPGGFATDLENIAPQPSGCAF